MSHCLPCRYAVHLCSIAIRRENWTLSLSNFPSSIDSEFMLVNSRFDIIRDQQKLTGFLNPISPFLRAIKALRYVTGLHLYYVG